MRRDKQISRRSLLAGAGKSVGVVCLAAVSLSAFVETAKKAQANALRPPGALPGDDFLAACVRCGLCVRACPYDTLKLATFADDAPVGTPFFIARDIPCFMCKDVPCAKACPTGALDRETDIRRTDMGLAVLVDHENCLNYKGISCSECHRVCPIRDEAITLELQVIDKRKMLIPTVHSDKCTGCGTCEKHCVLDHAAIRVLPRELGQGSAELSRAKS
jgi:ferredoxin-type protein NapG